MQDPRLFSVGQLEIETVDLILSLVRRQKPRNVIDSGASFGYLSAWISNSLEEIRGNDFNVIAIEPDPSRFNVAIKVFEQTNAKVTLFTQGSPDVLPQVISEFGQIDFAILDQWDKSKFIDEIRIISPSMPEGGIVIMDDVFNPEWSNTLSLIIEQIKPEFDVIKLPWGHGLAIAVKK
jgi:predicted O-methyltransferase YrrM